jgi:hypothetical protein
MPLKNLLHVSLLALFVIVPGQRSAPAAGKFVDLLEAGADSWQSPDPSRWTFTEQGELGGATPELNGAKTSPRASAFLLSKQTFGGDIIVAIDITIEPGKLVRLRFVKKGEDYSLWHDGRLIITYHKAGGYPPGPLQLRLTNARARIHRLEVQSDWSEG